MAEYLAWSDAEEADEEPRVPCVTDPSRVFASANDALAHDAARGFDLRAVARDARADFYGAVRIVNRARDAPRGVGRGRGAPQRCEEEDVPPRHGRASRVEEEETKSESHDQVE